MAKTETSVKNFKINTGTYDAIVEHLPEICEDELIFTDDKNIPIPTAEDSGKVIGVDTDGEYKLISPSESSGSSVIFRDWEIVEGD